MILFSMPCDVVACGGAGSCSANSLPHAPKFAARHIIINAKLQNVCNTCGLLQKDRKRSAVHLGFARLPVLVTDRPLLWRISGGREGGLLKNLAKSLTFYDCSLKAGNSFRYCQRPVSFCGPSLIEFSVNIYKEVFGI